ncbi:hypothetical protein V6N13_013979 [Hibiscus sabdariffa]|uniref:Uncharacterized protein n=1 Tax=Hibiscus sabdariffa TaxID=183260 RepID=A0ABR2RTV5_9ROSI
MLMAFLGLAISLLELHIKISEEKARWRWDKGIPWFYCPTATPSTHRLFGNFENIFGLLSAILQSIKVAADYFLYIQHSVNPIRFNFWSILLAICLLCSHFVKDLRPEVSVLHQTDKNV